MGERIGTGKIVYGHGITFIALETALGEVVPLPVYMLLLNDDLLHSLETKESRHGEDLKITSQHGDRKFRVWFVPGHTSQVRIEEWKKVGWEIVHSYRA